MKKLICTLVALLVMGTVSFAQANKEVRKTGAVNPSAAKGTQTAAPKTKKDGTPDMRHKENKQAAKPEQKLKKDGTPDMRYNHNKEGKKK